MYRKDSMAKHLFLDFDGTLIDSRLRQYALFTELVGEDRFTFEEYWHLKLQGVDQARMLSEHCGYSEERLVAFKKAWMEEIESPHRLELDELLPCVSTFLDATSKHFLLYLVTARQHHDRLVDQMSRLEIRQFFTGILNTAQRLSKADLVRKTVKIGVDDVFVGDTGEDIQAGQTLGITTVGTASGSMSIDRLKTYAPDLLVLSVAELLPAILHAKRTS